jgi:hypothetical protein
MKDKNFRRLASCQEFEQWLMTSEVSISTEDDGVFLWSLNEPSGQVRPDQPESGVPLQTSWFGRPQK